MPNVLGMTDAVLDVEDGPGRDLDDAHLVRVFEALSSTVRLRMLRQLGREAAVCACGFDVQTTIAQSTVSHHLRVLREAGLVRADRSGTFVHYSLESDAFDVIGRAIASLRSVVMRPDSGSRCCEADRPPDFETCAPRPPQP